MQWSAAITTQTKYPPLDSYICKLTSIIINDNAYIVSLTMCTQSVYKELDHCTYVHKLLRIKTATLLNLEAFGLAIRMLFRMYGFDIVAS